MTVAPPRPKDLPLSALRSFEAAARLGGFKAAAQELGVTPGAVTAQIKTLEASLGAPLFERGPRGVALTALGHRALPDLIAAFDALALAAHRLRAEAAPRVVHIATLPAIAQLWLAPRLTALRAAFPDIILSITAMEAPPNLKRTPYDLNLFYGEAGLLLAEDEIFPVCSPALAAHLRTPADMQNLPCLTDTTWQDDWKIWAKGAGLDSFVPRGPVFSLYALAVQEAAGGAGVLIGHAALVSDHLTKGTLVAPFATRVALNGGLRLWSARPLRAGQAAAQVVAFLRT